jgi:hypothetical protein
MGREHAFGRTEPAPAEPDQVQQHRSETEAGEQADRRSQSHSVSPCDSDSEEGGEKELSASAS